MRTLTKRPSDNEDRSNASNLSKARAGTASIQLARNNRGSNGQFNMQDLANNSPQVKQLRALQAMADSSVSPVQRQVIQLNGDGPEPTSGSLRPALGQNLMQSLFSPNWFAKGVFKFMNFAMFMEGQPLPKEHNDVLHESLITNQNGVLDTLIAENPHVMKSKGYTPIYLLGKTLIHRPLEYYLKNRRDRD